jgi:hypothetical protein
VPFGIGTAITLTWSAYGFEETHRGCRALIETCFEFAFAFISV